jgi:tRNA(Leu) C34 or U34 (ribose-2'-O)-methylase TrmL
MIHIVLYEPEIPQNTGNISRTCAVTGCHLHLIEPLGFDLSERSIRRAGLDYWKYLTVTTYKNWDEFRELLHSTDLTPVEDATNTNYPSRLYWGAELVEIEGKKYYFGCNIVGKLLVQLRATQGNLPYTLPADLHIFGQPVLPI